MQDVCPTWFPPGSVKGSISVFCPGQGFEGFKDKFTFVFLFSCKMFNYEPNCLQMVYQNELPSE